MKKLAAFLILTFVLAGMTHAGGDTGPGDVFQSLRDMVDYVRYFFSTPETGFNASAISDEAARSGQLITIERREFFSRELGEEKNYVVLLPPGYHDAQKRYPAYYLLHGYGGDDRSWATRGNITQIYQDLLSGGMVK